MSDRGWCGNCQKWVHVRMDGKLRRHGWHPELGMSAVCPWSERFPGFILDKDLVKTIQRPRPTKRGTNVRR